MHLRCRCHGVKEAVEEESRLPRLHEAADGTRQIPNSTNPMVNFDAILTRISQNQWQVIFSSVSLKA
jgi:hypothetical protein